MESDSPMEQDDSVNEWYGYGEDNYPNAGSSGSVIMTQQAQQERRNSIREIMADETLTPLEKRRNIQSLMDGRRRSSASHVSTGSGSSVGGMARSAMEAAENDQSDNEDNQSCRSHMSNSNNQYYHNGDMTGDTMADSECYEYGDNSTQQIQLMQEQKDAGAPNEELFQSMDISGAAGRKQRSSSMPLWSENTTRAAAPLVAARSNAIWDDPLNISRRMEKSRPPCNHYERNCTIISPCCGLAFGCRICHDECPVLPMPFAQRPPPNPPPGTPGDQPPSQNSAAGTAVTGSTESTVPQERILNWEAVERAKHKHEKRRSMPLNYDQHAGEETHHEIDRFAIAEIICRLCYTRQSSKTNFCTACDAQFGAYYCNICNLWMSDDESPYHCADCGFCRVGGRENFRHCDDCGMCIDALLFDDHNCKAGKYMSNCPVCQEDLFSSRDASHEMPCGHAIHWHCFKELTTYDTRCPVCKKTAETPEHMAPTWQAMAMGIALQPVPPELARVVTILCNDCEETDENRRWHFLGVRCMHCMSFNTTVERTTLMGRDAASYLDEMDRKDGNCNGTRPMDAS
ncbi:zinc-ribbon domain containing protein [Nitzschia inconspicua]|uniref:Zinc-ribbon domain containing protein n=1 Tax=Nitzschia inconspicua TaxID=303405 RepID=A0A9K3LLK8_9STRA|nr:zinc-ribbon domain containing protein [Nitzschia inconspicua]